VYCRANPAKILPGVASTLLKSSNVSVSPMPSYTAQKAARRIEGSMHTGTVRGLLYGVRKTALHCTARGSK
jgi:hypothetical protein